MMNTSNKNLIAYIGRNGSGKTYALNNILTNSPIKTLYISEEGIAKVEYQKNKISINMEGNKYLYADEMRRGEKTNLEEYQITEKAKKIIEYASTIISKLESIKKKSQGQKKLENMMNIFLNYNLNNIDTILFDEPENFFDEEYLKLVAKLIITLIDNSYRVRFATHNSRLLSILEMDIDNIVLIHNRTEKTIRKSDIKNIFSEIAEIVDKKRNELKYSESNSISYKLNIHKVSVVFDNYLDYHLKNIEFYSSLFYKDIIIVEGNSDLEALKTIKESFNDTVYIFSANGKAWIPFYVRLFLELGKKVRAIIDVDKEENTHSAILTSILEEIGDLRLIQHNPDMETEYGIDMDFIGDKLGMNKNVRKRNRGWLKQISAYYYFKVQGNWNKLEQKILYTGNEEFGFN